MTRVAVVTGGGGGIGAAIAEELARSGTFVVTVDPLVTVDGREQLASPEETTAGRIVAQGGSARASAASVTDATALRELFEGLAEEFGGVDVVVNVAGITRPTSFTRGSDDDWRSVLTVHLDGYRNVLSAALPIMVAAGHGHILGVTSGSGWRSADAGAYSCAKRAVASLTWQMGRSVPAGVVVNAISPIAMTRMVTAALARRPPARAASSETTASSDTASSSSTGGLSLASMPTPEQLGPLAAHLTSDGFTTCRGRVLFTGGSEMAVIDEPRLLEVIPSAGGHSLAHLLEVATSVALVPAELHQESRGGTNPRFAAILDDGAEPGAPAPSVIRSCAVVGDRGDLVDDVVDALESRGVSVHRVDAVEPGANFEAAAGALDNVADRDATMDAVVLALAGGPAATAGPDWERVLAEHVEIVDQIHRDAAWSRAVADLSKRAERSIRLVTLTDAATAGGRSRAQASAQLSRASLAATHDRVAAFAVSVETTAQSARRPAAELAVHLLCSAESLPLAGAELVVGDATIGLRSHPHVGAGIVLGSGGVPAWFDEVLGSIVR